MTSTVSQDVTSAVQLLPTVVSSVTTIANDVTSDTAAHKNLLQTGLDVLSALTTSANNIATSGAVGHAAVSQIQAGETAIAVAAAAISPLEAAWNAIEALIKEL